MLNLQQLRTKGSGLEKYKKVDKDEGDILKIGLRYLPTERLRNISLPRY